LFAFLSRIHLRSTVGPHTGVQAFSRILVTARRPGGTVSGFCFLQPSPCSYLFYLRTSYFRYVLHNIHIPRTPSLFKASGRLIQLKPLHKTQVRPSVSAMGEPVDRETSNPLSRWNVFPGSSPGGHHEDVDAAELGEDPRIHRTVSPSLHSRCIGNIPVAELYIISSASTVSREPGWTTCRTRRSRRRQLW